MKIRFTRKALAASLLAATIVSPTFANEGAVPKGVPRLDHVWIIMMENHAFNQIVGNPSAPFMNDYIKHVSYATNYFAVAHPSLTNYLEVAGGSNFGVLNDNSPDWHNKRCTNNLALGTAAFDNGNFGDTCPIYGVGTDAATPLVDTSNETTPSAGINSVTEIDGKLAIPADKHISGKTIADQLVAAGLTWKSYQESLPASGADFVNNADGFFTDKSNIQSVLPGETQTLIDLYAVKHNPFVYFQSVQENTARGLGLANVVPFSGPRGLYDDLASGHVPNYSFVVPNQCNDQHGRTNAGPQCEEDPNDNGTLQGLNPALILIGDQALRNLVTAIHESPAWQDGHNAIVIVWDENDYSATPNTNKVLLTVDTNYSDRDDHRASGKFYTHFSLLRSIESGFRLPCLNHACDVSADVMSDLFGSDDLGRDQH
jgi:hypothetical protein